MVNKLPDIKDSNFYLVFGWMISKLGLRGAERDVYAVLYGFTQEGSWYFGSVGYIASIVGVSYKTALECLQSLVQRGLVEREEGKEGSPNRYRVKIRTKQKENASPYRDISPVYESQPSDITDEEIRAFYERFRKE